jgi:hypothetical protein
MRLIEQLAYRDQHGKMSSVLAGKVVSGGKRCSNGTCARAA